jgi:hypothetical protein
MTTTATATTSTTSQSVAASTPLPLANVTVAPPIPWYQRPQVQFAAVGVVSIAAGVLATVKMWPRR